jgi:hypothetical protein
VVIKSSVWPYENDKTSHKDHRGFLVRSDCPRCIQIGNATTKQESRFRQGGIIDALKSIYIIGSLRNPAIVSFANELQREGFEAFADWFSAGPEADDILRDYSKARDRNYKQTLQSYAARHIFSFDKFHLDRCDAAVLVMPAGKSGHIELGYLIGKGKPGFILFDEEPERIDVMHQFATDIFFNKEELFKALKNRFKIGE